MDNKVVDENSNKIRIVGVRFKDVGKVYYFDPCGYELDNHDGVIVETVRGIEYGTVVLKPSYIESKDYKKSLKKILRKATDDDIKRLEENRIREGEALKICQERIDIHNMDMKLTGAEYTFDGKKVIFYFTADDRVDFRELVKDLASVFKTRIELRQIGVRDEAKKLGGLGSCGRACCCSEFMGDFQPVSIKMAKEQNLSLSPTKISGLCGRLMCCLAFENDHYVETKRIIPKTGSFIDTADGPAEVLEGNIITEEIKAKITLPDGSFDIKSYKLKDIKQSKKSELRKNNKYKNREVSTGGNA